MEAWLPEAGMIETKNETRFYRTPAERYPKVSCMRPEGAMEYYTDQTKPEFQKPRSTTTTCM
jgi:hypothetical protein